MMTTLPPSDSALLFHLIVVQNTVPNRLHNLAKPLSESTPDQPGQGNFCASITEFVAFLLRFVA